MAGEDKTILVYDDFSADAPILLGKLYIGVIKGGESYSFEYDKEWLTKNNTEYTGVKTICNYEFCIIESS